MHHTGVEQRSEAREELLAGQLLVADLMWDAPARRTQAIVLNISEGGMAVQAFRPLAQGRLSGIQLSTGIAPLAEGSGAVAWQGPAGLIGIRFKERLPDLHKHVLSDSKLQNFDSALPLLSLREKSGTSFDTTLHLFACSAMAMTGAAGVAIAVGDSSGMECRGSVGTAPEVGAKLVPDSGLTGQCLSTGAVIICKDARNDSRVNKVAAEQMESRAILIIPITDAGNMLGLLEAFSRQKNHFNKSDVETLSPLVRVLAKAFTDENHRIANEGPNALATEVRTAAGLNRTDPEVYAAPLEMEESTPSYLLVYLHSLRHSRAFPIVLGSLVALLVVAIAMALSGTRLGRRAEVSGKAGIKTPEAQRLNATPVSKAGIRFNPEFIRQKVGRSFEVDVMLTGVKNLWSAPMQISYDPEVLKLVTVTSGGMLSGDQQSATLVHREDMSAGRVDVSISRPLSSPGVNGDGVVFTLAFLTKATGTTKLRVTQSGLRDTATAPIVAESSDATVIVAQVAKGGEEDTEFNTTPSPTRLLPQSIASPTRLNTGLQAEQSLRPVDSIPPPLSPATQSSPAQLAELKLPTVVVPAPVQRSLTPPNFELQRTLKGHTKWVSAVAFSADGEHLVSGSWDRSVKMWDLSSGHEMSTIATEGAGIQTSTVSHDGKLIAVQDAGNNITIMNAVTGEAVRTLKGDRLPWDKSWVYSIAFSPDDSLLAAALDTKTIRLWKVGSGLAVRDLGGDARDFLYVAFSPDGRWLATGGDAKTIELWNVATGRVGKILKGHQQEVYAVAFSPDGRWLASASKDKTVRLWSVFSGLEVHTLTGHQSSVTSVAFSSNSRWLASSGWDKTIRIWDVEAGREVQTITGHAHQIYSLAFDTRGGWLATGSVDGTIKLWRLRPDIDLAVIDEDKRDRNASAAAVAGPLK